MLREQVSDEALVNLIARWLRNASDDRGILTRPTRGVPQGSPLSPLLSNLYLTPLDRWAEDRGHIYVRFADDFTLLCDSREAADAVLEDLERMLGETLALSLKPAKTWLASPEEGFDFLGFRLGGETVVRIRRERVEGAHEALTRLLDTDRAASTPTIQRELDAWSRGYAGYFDIGHQGVRSDLQSLEAARRAKVRVLALSRQEDPEVWLQQTVPLTRHDDLPQRPEGAYPVDLPAAPDAPPLDVTPERQGSLSSVDRSRRAVQARQRDNQPAAVMVGGHLMVFGHGAFLALAGERLQVRRARTVMFEAPLPEIRVLVIHGRGATVSTPLLESLMRTGAPVVFGGPGKPWGVLRGPAGKASHETLAAQVAARSSPVGTAVAIELVSAKLDNQDRHLRYLAKYRRRREQPLGVRLGDAAGRIRAIRDDLHQLLDVESDVARRRLFSAEGRGAGVYWDALKSVLGDAFPGRTGRGATDPINMALNYGYGVLYAHAWRAAITVGLEPSVGLLHASPGGRGALVFDLVEPFRVPAVDRPLVAWLNRGGRVQINRDGELRSRTRLAIADALARALARDVPWDGATRTLAAWIPWLAARVRDAVKGGDPVHAPRMRW